MEITEVRIKLMEEVGERLQAFCSITFDNCFVVRDLKIIEGPSGAFVAMPSRKLSAHCPQCGCKNHLRAGYCNQCGLRLKEDRAVKDEDGRAKMYADIAHPINSSCREMIQERVIRAFHTELERAKQPGYVSSYDGFDEDFVAQPHSAAKRVSPQPELAARRPAGVGGNVPKIEPAEPGPRGPHKVPAPERSPSGQTLKGQSLTPHLAPLPPAASPAETPQRSGGFGSGIF